MPLSLVQRGQRVRVVSLPVYPALQGRLLAMGIRPGAELEVLRRSKPGRTLHLASGLLEFMLRHDHAEELEVEALPQA